VQITATVDEHAQRDAVPYCSSRVGATIITAMNEERWAAMLCHLEDVVSAEVVFLTRVRHVPCKVVTPVVLCAWIVSVAERAVRARTTDLSDLISDRLRVIAVLAVCVRSGLRRQFHKILDKGVRAARAGLDVLDVAPPAQILRTLR